MYRYDNSESYSRHGCINIPYVDACKITYGSRHFWSPFYCSCLVHAPVRSRIQLLRKCQLRIKCEVLGIISGPLFSTFSTQTTLYDCAIRWPKKK